eukprot:scaffold18324_cov176-Amphora_coffeaeformis.AAC.3
MTVVKGNPACRTSKEAFGTDSAKEFLVKLTGISYKPTLWSMISVDEASLRSLRVVHRPSVEYMALVWSRYRRRPFLVALPRFYARVGRGKRSGNSFRGQRPNMSRIPPTNYGSTGVASSLTSQTVSFPRRPTFRRLVAKSTY